MLEQFELRKSYMQDEVLRNSFNELANETFGLDFESWYKKGLTNQVNMDTIIEAFGNKINKVVFGFTPLINKGYQVEKLYKENTTLFLKGKGFDLFEQNKIIFPTLSHA